VNHSSYHLLNSKQGDTDKQLSLRCASKKLSQCHFVVFLISSVLSSSVDLWVSDTIQLLFSLPALDNRNWIRPFTTSAVIRQYSERWHCGAFFPPLPSMGLSSTRFQQLPSLSTPRYHPLPDSPNSSPIPSQSQPSHRHFQSHTHFPVDPAGCLWTTAHELCLGHRPLKMRTQVRSLE